MSTYRTRIRQLPIQPGKPGSYYVEVYLAGVGWLPLADKAGKGVATFSSRHAARGHAGLVDSREQVLGSKYVC